MRSFILFLKRVGIKKVVAVLIAVVLISVATVYYATKPLKLDTGYQVLFDQGKYSEVIPELEDWTKTHPDDLNSLELLAASYIQKADAEPVNAKSALTKAISTINKIVKMDPNRSETYRLAGVARLYQNNIASAEASFNQAIKISNSQNTNAIVGLGMVHEHKGELTLAITRYQEALNREPSNEMALLGMARHYITLNNPGEAEKRASSAAAVSKNNAILGEAYAILGSANSLKPNYKAAVENYKKSLTYRPGNVHTAVLLGETLINLYRSAPSAERGNLLAQIIDAANKAVLIKPDYIYAYALLYKADLLQNKYAEANQIGKKIVSLLKTDTVLSAAEKTEYAKFYSGEITSVTIKSVKMTDILSGSTGATSTNNLKK